jgi:hypothetical protein
MEELNMRQVNFKWVPHALIAGQKLERAMISQKLFGRINKLQVNGLARTITEDETWVYFENPRSAICVGADVRRPTRPKQLIAAKKVMFWVCFTPIGIVDIIMLPPGETFDRFFFMGIVLDSLKKKLAQIHDPNPEKDHFCIWRMPDPIWPIMKFKQTTSPGCPIQLAGPNWHGRLLAFWVS